MKQPVFVRITAVLGLMALAACVTPPQSQPCATPNACAAAQFMAQEMSKDVGRDFGAGVTLRSVQAAGSLLVVDLQMPIPAGPLEPVQKRAVHDLAIQGFVSGLCDDNTTDIFQLGNAFQMRSFGTDSVIMGASTVQSCGG